MNEVLPRPRLWSDFDGTAVEIASTLSLRNIAKYPLKSIAGYADFLEGVRSNGIEIAGVVSARPNKFGRSWATRRSIAKLGLGDFFDDNTRVILAGSEMKKGAHLVSESYKSPVGMLEDRPHRLGPVLLGILSTVSAQQESAHPITIGVVSHPKTQTYFERMAERIDSITNNLSAREMGDGAIRFAGDGWQLDIASLPQYSVSSGEVFADRLKLEQ